MSAAVLPLETADNLRLTIDEQEVMQCCGAAVFIKPALQA